MHNRMKSRVILLFLLSFFALCVFTIQIVSAGQGQINSQRGMDEIEQLLLSIRAPVLSPIQNPDGNGEYLVDWDNVPSAVRYLLQEDDNIGFTTPTVRYDGPASQFQVTGQLYNTWYYRVLATNNVGEDSPWSNIELVMVDQAAPTAPALDPISNPDGDGIYLVDWSEVLGATAYRLEEAETSAFISPTIRYEGTQTVFQVSGQLSGSWYYRVLAVNSFGESPWSNIESVDVLPAPPVLAPIENIDGDGDYLVDWSDISGITGYRLEEAQTSDFISPTVRYEGVDSQYQVTGQVYGAWFYRVLASDGWVDSPWSNTESVNVDQAPPGAPTLDPISNPDGDGTYLVMWSAELGAASYRLEEAPTSDFVTPTVRYEGQLNQFQVTGQLAGTWYYRVLAGNIFGISHWSNSESASVAPSAPVLLPIDNVDGDGAYLVDWEDALGSASYRLEEAATSDFISSTVRYEGAVSQFQVTAQPEGIWYYRVLASNTGGDSPWSNIESVIVLPPPPISPTLAPIDNPDGDGDYLVDWSDVLDATGYRLEEAPTSDFISSTVRYEGAVSQFQVTAQLAGTWYYRVLASNDGGDSPWSNTESVVVNVEPPTSPILSPIDNPDGNGDYLVDWSDVLHASSYRLEEAPTSDFITPTVVYEGSVSQFQVTAQLVGTWYYRVLASNAGGDSPWSNTESVIVLPPPPISPTLSPIDNPDGNGDYLVDWSDVLDATGYRLEEAPDSDFITPTVRYQGATSVFTVTAQPAGTWYYRVLASNTGGDSPWSNTESVIVLPPLPISPTLAPIDNPDGDGDYLVDWSDVLDATGYRLEEAPDSDFITPTVRYQGATSVFTVTAQPEGTWYYRVLASNTGGDSPWSNTESVIVLPPPPNSPTLSPIDNPDGNGDYLVDWSDVLDATSYRLEEAPDSDFITPTVRYQGATSVFTVTAQPEGTWYYRVLASNTGGDSPWSNIESVIVLPPLPISPTLAPIDNPDGDGDYLVDWNDVLDATGYRLEEAPTSDFITPTVRYQGATSVFTVTAQPEGTWYYRVLASNTGGDSPWSNTESVVVNVEPPTSPTLAPIDNPDGNGDYLVDWSIMRDATGYQLQEDDNQGFTSPVVRYQGAASQFAVANQPAGTWYYRVLASNAGGNSPWSNIEAVDVDLPPSNQRIYLPIINLSKLFPPGVQILPESYDYISHDTLFIIGEVLNNTSNSLTLVDVTVNFFNADGLLVDTDKSYLWPLDMPAHEKGCFEISMDVPPDWAYYQFESVKYNLSPTSTGLNIINYSGIYSSADGDFDIIGQVRNSSNQPANYVGVSGTLYNAVGLPVGCEHVRVNSTNLNPGQTSSFAINYLGYYRDYADVKSFRLRVAGDLP